MPMIRIQSSQFFNHNANRNPHLNWKPVFTFCGQKTVQYPVNPYFETNKTKSPLKQQAFSYRLDNQYFGTKGHPSNVHSPSHTVYYQTPTPNCFSPNQNKVVLNYSSPGIQMKGTKPKFKFNENFKNSNQTQVPCIVATIQITPRQIYTNQNTPPKARFLRIKSKKQKSKQKKKRDTTIQDLMAIENRNFQSRFAGLKNWQFGVASIPKLEKRSTKQSEEITKGKRPQEIPQASTYKSQSLSQNQQSLQYQPPDLEFSTQHLNQFESKHSTQNKNQSSSKKVNPISFHEIVDLEISEDTSDKFRTYRDSEKNSNSKNQKLKNLSGIKFSPIPNSQKSKAIASSKSVKSFKSNEFSERNLPTNKNEQKDNKLYQKIFQLASIQSIKYQKSVELIGKQNFLTEQLIKQNQAYDANQAYKVNQKPSSQKPSKQKWNDLPENSLEAELSEQLNLNYDYYFTKLSQKWLEGEIQNHEKQPKCLAAQQQDEQELTRILRKKPEFISQKTEVYKNKDSSITENEQIDISF